jgi:hypothetical protein
MVSLNVISITPNGVGGESTAEMFFLVSGQGGGYHVETVILLSTVLLD